MEFFCELCDRSIIENETKYYEYLATFHKKDYKSLYEKYTIDNIK